MRVLLIEDDEFIAKTLETVLIKENYAVDVAIDGEVGWRLIETFAYDMILLDIMLPKLDGITICRQLREREYQMPVLLITAQNSSSDRVIGLDAGADDYVAKPFELSELLARMRVLLRRGSSPVVPILEWNTLRLDPASCQVSYADRPLHLTPKEYRLLELFLRNPRHVFSRSSILEHLWGLDETPTEDTVTAHIKGLRQKLKQAGAPGNFIETVYGMGYRLKQSSLSLPSSPPTQTNGSDKTAPSLPSSPPAQTNGFDKTAKKPDERSEENSEQARKELEEIWRKQQTRSALRDVWGKYESYNHHRLQVIEQAIAALRENNLTGELRTQAQASAHKLAGTLGVFDLPEGSRLALELEQYFKSGHIPNAQGLQHLSSLVAGLKCNFNAICRNRLK
ncbi:MAG: response regulator [Cyanobacteria bacterium CRU_2_1]|nr:response regulator [Cyanobacteria bacterium CRU_2_1]